MRRNDKKAQEGFSIQADFGHNDPYLFSHHTLQTKCLKARFLLQRGDSVAHAI